MIYLPDLARWITVDPDNLDDQEKAKLAEARERCEHPNSRSAPSVQNPPTS